MDNAELNHYRAVCYIQDEFIKGKISREEMEQKLEIERLKLIECLRKQNEYIMQQMDREKRFSDFIFAEFIKTNKIEREKHYCGN